MLLILRCPIALFALALGTSRRIFFCIYFCSHICAMKHKSNYLVAACFVECSMWVRIERVYGSSGRNKNEKFTLKFTSYYKLKIVGSATRGFWSIYKNWRHWSKYSLPPDYAIEILSLIRIAAIWTILHFACTLMSSFSNRASAIVASIQWSWLLFWDWI